jgi:SOS-response transcriptional repressor LexA
MSRYRQQHATTPPVYCTRCGDAVAHHRAPLTVKQARLFAFIQARITTLGYAPTFDEMATEFGYLSLATVHEHLNSLERKGYITREFNRARAITLVGGDPR